MIHDEWIDAVAFSPDGKTVLTGCSDRMARLWDSQTGKQLGPALVHTHDVQAVAYSPDAKSIVTGSADGELQVWDANTFEKIGQPFQYDARLNSIDVSPNGDLILSVTDDGTARLWDLRTGQYRSVLEHAAELYAVAFSPDGSRFVTAGETDFKVWDTATCSPVHDLRGHDGSISSVDFSPDGRWIIGSCGDARRGSGMP